MRTRLIGAWSMQQGVWERYRARALGETVSEPLKMSLLLPNQAMGPGKSQGLSLSPTLTQVRVSTSPETVSPDVSLASPSPCPGTPLYCRCLSLLSQHRRSCRPLSVQDCLLTSLLVQLPGPCYVARHMQKVPGRGWAGLSLGQWVLRFLIRKLHSSPLAESWDLLHKMSNCRN